MQGLEQGADRLDPFQVRPTQGLTVTGNMVGSSPEAGPTLLGCHGTRRMRCVSGFDPASQRCFPEREPRMDYPFEKDVACVDDQGRCKWGRRTIHVGTALACEPVLPWPHEHRVYRPPLARTRPGTLLDGLAQRRSEAGSMRISASREEVQDKSIRPRAARCGGRRSGRRAPRTGRRRSGCRARRVPGCRAQR